MNLKLSLKFIIACFAIFVCWNNSKAQRYRYFTSDEGLSNSQINQIYQDKKGFIWIATEDGLNHFDGTRFTQYRHQPNDSCSLKGNYVQTLFEDSKGNFWVGTINGLQLFDRSTNKFRNFPLSQGQSSSVFLLINSIVEDKRGFVWVSSPGNGVFRINPNNLKVLPDNGLNAKIGSMFVSKFFEDRLGNIWCGTEDKGVVVLDPVSEIVDNTVLRGEGANSLANKQISSICEDAKGNVLVGALNSGLWYYNRANNSFSRASDGPNMANLPVKSLLKDDNGIVWVGTDGRGIKLWENEKLTDFEISGSQMSLAKSKAHALLIDKQGNIWIGLFQKGVMMLPRYSNKFEYYGFSHNPEYSIGNGCTMSIDVSPNGNVWAGTDGYGLFRIDRDSRKTKQYSVETGNLHGNVVMSVLYGNERTVWVGTYLNGFAKLDPATGRFEKIPLGSGAETERIMALAKSTDGVVWVGTYGGGIFAYNPLTHSLINYTSTSIQLGDTISHNWINVLKFGKPNELWVGTFKGLDCFNTTTRTNEQFNVENGLLCDNTVYCVAHDRNGKTWVGTSNGLSMISADRKSAKFFYAQHGLSGNVINGIEEDDNGNLWISTNSGLCRYSPAMDNFTNFYSFEGLQSNEFRRNAVCKSPDGKLLFGGINGITAFYPQNIGVTRDLPDLYFTDFKIFNQSVAVGQKSGNTVVLPKAVIENPSITVRHTDNVFSIEFIALEYTNPEKIVYKYKMDGFDDAWKTTNVSNRIVTYTNLSPGKYVFQVVASDNFDNQKVASLSIRILPPWWRSWWAFIIYLAAAAGVVFAILKEIHHRVEQTHLLMEAQHAEQVNEARLQLFSNISHEIKTPLTLIVNPLEKLRSKETDPEKGTLYDLMHRNSMRILRLMDQLMDVRKIDKGQLELKFCETDMVAFVKDVIESFDYAAKSKNIKLQSQFPSSPTLAWIDRGNFDKVLSNLLANAFKFTPQGGEIALTLKKPDDTHLEILVEDNGVGIDESMLEQIFERFFQVHNESYKGGWGIGLHLSRKLVEMHYGQIKAIQRQPQGVAFLVTLPLGNSHLPPHQIVTGTNDNYNQPARFGDLDLVAQKPDNSRAKGKPKIVIAEDDDEIRNFLISELKGHYQLFHAPNGKLAWGLVTSEMPDLVLSDVMMPELNGLELCRKIKAHANTSTIPVILLTAKGKDEDVVEGLEYGAEHYIAKPFNIEVLKSIIARSIESRHALKVSYSRDAAFDFGGIKLDSADEKLMAKLMQALKEHISDPSMSVETLSKEIGISRVHLHRKLKELTNQSPRDFIKYMRLTQAAHLLTASDANVSEVAYAVGFSSHAYFTNCFRDQFGISPTDFVEKAKTDPHHPLVKAALKT